jgi:hypothetical protein
MTSTVAPDPAPTGEGVAGALTAAEAIPAQAVAAELAGMLARLGELTDAAAADTTEADRVVDAARVDAITLTERVAAAAAATQAALAVRFARSQVVTQQQAVARSAGA